MSNTERCEHCKELQEEFDAYIEGSEHAFGVVVNDKSDLLKKIANLERNIADNFDLVQRAARMMNRAP